MKVRAPLYFIRHGQTDWNIDRRFQGRSDIPLNDCGRNQALENAALLACSLQMPDDYQLTVVSSPLSRATETTKLILAELGQTNAHFTTSSALCEVSFGAFEGLTSAQAKQKYYVERQRRRKDRWSIAPPDGESFAERVDGVARFLHTLPAYSLVVSHSGIMRILFHLLQEIAPLEAVNLDIPHIGVHIWNGKQINSRQICG